MKSFEEAKKIATCKNYDYLDPRNFEFDTDYDSFMTKIDDLKKNVGDIIEKNYVDVWETPQGIRFLTRFEKVFKSLKEIYLIKNFTFIIMHLLIRSVKKFHSRN